MGTISLAPAGSKGLIFDIPPAELPPTAWTAGRNIRFSNGAASPAGLQGNVGPTGPSGGGGGSGGTQIYNNINGAGASMGWTGNGTPSPEQVAPGVDTGTLIDGDWYMGVNTLGQAPYDTFLFGPYNADTASWPTPGLKLTGLQGAQGQTGIPGAIGPTGPAGPTGPGGGGSGSDALSSITNGLVFNEITTSHPQVWNWSFGPVSRTFDNITNFDLLTSSVINQSKFNKSNLQAQDNNQQSLAGMAFAGTDTGSPRANFAITLPGTYEMKSMAYGLIDF